MGRSVTEIRAMKAENKKISVLTAYDAAMARLLSECGVDALLVGDSLGMVVLGYDSTVPVTMDEMIHHAKAVRRGAPDTFVIGDMPYGSYQTGVRDAVLNSIRFIKDAGCDAVKLEGGIAVCSVIKGLVDAGVPVMGHIGLTPQSASQLGGYRVQGRGLDDARRMLNEARALEEAGVFSMVIECVPDSLVKIITESVSVPTIGIGAGIHCDGQVLVTHDLIGMFEKFTPKFVKKYVNLAPMIKEAVTAFHDEVKVGKYPEKEHSFTSEVDYRQLLDE
ncbi:3-methyl-2-oxobutanoate hydroxymethyltransferase [Desulfomarina sp.]